MTRYSVRFLPQDRVVEVDEEETIASAAREAGVNLPNLCGGEGVCGQCRVRVEQGQVAPGERSLAFFPEEERQAGYVLACQSKVQGDLEIWVPKEGRQEEAQIMIGEALGSASGVELKPLVRKFYLQLSPPSLADNIADIDRVSRELRQQVGWHSFDIHLGCLQNLASLLRENDWKITVTLVKTSIGYRIQAIEPGDTTARQYGVAVDVGTTTIVAQLVDLCSGEILGVQGTPNTQAGYGEDVISRMIYACGKGGLHPLHAAVIQDINDLIDKLVRDSGTSREEIGAVVAAGNTTMSHFLLGLTPCSIRLEPYVPTADVYPQVPAREIGIRIGRSGILETLPGVASYVGGDIVGGVVACGIPDQPEIRGLIDIGTNGEIAIGNQDWLVCCSASAGPAFEGGGTRCGMRATRGAIEKVAIADGTLTFQTIGGVKPRGICGSGLIDCLYELVTHHIIEAGGKFHTERDDPRLGFEDGVPQYTIAFAQETEDGRPVVITETDIDHLMKSKGAVFAAIKCLMDYIGLGFDQIDTFFVAGGFGSYLDIPKAVAIGLLPDIPVERIRFIGNSSLTGARMALLSEEILEKCVVTARAMTNIELSNYPPFMDEYVAALFLPHTDRRLFPSVSY